MPNFENHSCPVCKNIFEQEDDIVVCPVCGTPHHRACYQLSGHCVNAGLHAANYDYYKDKQSVMQAPATESAPPLPSSAAEQEAPFMLSLAQFENHGEAINGEAAADVAAAVRTNIPRFLSKFRKMETTGKTKSWNWSAFIFGGFYLLFRKMYQAGCAVMSLYFSFYLMTFYALQQFAPKSYTLFQSVLEASAQQNASLVEERLKALSAASDMQNAGHVFTAFFLLIILMHIVIAVSADALYRSMIFKRIKRIREQLAEGAAFNFSSFALAEMHPALTQEQMKQMYLARRGGISLFAPTAVLLLLEFLIRLFLSTLLL